jgi:hypothetical protein
LDAAEEDLGGEAGGVEFAACGGFGQEGAGAVAGGVGVGEDCGKGGPVGVGEDAVGVVGDGGADFSREGGLVQGWVTGLVTRPGGPVWS